MTLDLWEFFNPLMSHFRFVCLGVGDAFSKRWYSSTLALEYEGTWLLIDCPHPIRKILAEAGQIAGLDLDVSRFSGVVLTHLHADHASGLEGWGYYSTIVLGRKTVLLTHETAARNLDAAMGNLLSNPKEPKAHHLSDFFDVILLKEHDAVSFGPYSISCRPTTHSIPTRSLRISAGGRTLGYSADTSYDPSLIDWLADADLIVHETNLGPHTPYEKLAALPESLRHKLRLIHYPDFFDLSSSVIEPLHQGQIYLV